MVSTVSEIPEELHDQMAKFLESRPDWDSDRVMTAALSLFLLQNSPDRGDSSRSESDRQAARIYLDSLFKRPVEQL